MPVSNHRGLDTLRAAAAGGARGTCAGGTHSNRGFLRSLDALRRAAGTIGEVDEEQRCRALPAPARPRVELE